MKNKIVLLTLMVIIITETVFLVYFINQNKKLSSAQNQSEEKNNNQNETQKEAVALFDLEPLVEFFSDNVYLTVLKFNSPENLLTEELDISTLVYDYLSINNFELKRVVNLGEQAQGPGYKYAIEEMQIYLKDGVYYIEYYHQMDTEKPGTMIIKKENEKFYLYSNSGYNYY